MISRVSTFSILLLAAFDGAHPFSVDQSTRPRYSSTMSGAGATLAPRTLTKLFLMDISKGFTDMLSIAPFTEAQTVERRLFEQEIFSGMAHLTLDIATLIARGTAILRLTTVVGRLFAMGADYIPDEIIQPEELVFQICMLMISFTGFIHSISPMLMASFNAKPPSIRDRRTFQVLFRKAGVTWTQYRALSVSAFDWVTVAPGQIIISEEDLTNDESDNSSIYWLYIGQVLVESKGKLLIQVTRPRAPRLNDITAGGMGLFGEMRLAESIHNHNKKQDNDDQNTYPHATVRAGETGATLLRINTHKLKYMMAHDSHLADSILRLLLSSMQDKLNAVIAA